MIRCEKCGRFVAVAPVLWMLMQQTEEGLTMAWTSSTTGFALCSKGHWILRPIWEG